MAPYLVLQTWWSATAAGVETKATPEAMIADLEDRYGIALPADFREYLSCSAPTGENLDDQYGNWWPIERIKNIPDEYEYPVSDPVARTASKHLIFLDFCIWSWAWAISCADGENYGKVAIIGVNREQYVADSFADFVARYTTDWDSLSKVS